MHEEGSMAGDNGQYVFSVRVRVRHGMDYEMAEGIQKFDKMEYKI